MANKEPAFVPVRQDQAAQPAPTQSPLPSPLPSPMQRRVTFDEWWTQVAHAKKLSNGMKEAVRIHMEAKGFTKNANYDAGLKDFGIK